MAAARPDVFHSQDLSVNINLWSSLELNVGIICASVPALKVLVVRFAPMLASLYGTRKKPSHGATVHSQRTSDLGDSDADPGRRDPGAHGECAEWGGGGLVEMQSRVHHSITMSSLLVADGASQENLVEPGRAF